MREKSGEDAYLVFVNRVKSEAMSRLGNVRIESVIRKYEGAYGDSLYGFLERMQDEGRMLRVSGMEGMYFVPLGDSVTFALSNGSGNPRGN